MPDADPSETSIPAAAPDGAAARAARIAFRWVRSATETRSLVVLAIAVRLVTAWSSPALQNDGVSLLRGAERVVAQGPGALLDLPHHPLPPALYALASLVTDAQVAAAVLTAIASGLAVWPLHSLARRACGRHAATAACILYVALPKAVDVGSGPLAEGLFLPFFLGSLALAAAARDAGGRITRRLLGAGLLAGLAYLCRPEGLVAFPAALAAAALDGRPGRARRAGLVSLAFVMVALPYVALLSAHRGGLSISPKKDIARFVGVEAPRVGVPNRPPPVAPTAPDATVASRTTAADVVRGLGGALDSAVTFPVAVLIVIGLLDPRRWRRKRSRRPRLLLAGTALLLLVLLARLQAGWGYAAGRHALAAGLLLLAFAGQGLMTLGSVLPRVTSQRRFAIVAATLLAIPLGCRAVLRPPGEGGVGARRLGERLAEVSSDGIGVRIASVAEPRVAYYAHRGLRERDGRADDVPLWGRFIRPLELGADLDAVADALAGELRREADWIVLDVTPPLRGEDESSSLVLARALRERGVLGTPAVAAGDALAAFPVAR